MCLVFLSAGVLFHGTYTLIFILFFTYTSKSLYTYVYFSLPFPFFSFSRLKIPSILPPQIKAEGMSLSILVSYISAFIIVQSFPVLESLFGSYFSLSLSLSLFLFLSFSLSLSLFLPLFAFPPFG